LPALICHCLTPPHPTPASPPLPPLHRDSILSYSLLGTWAGPMRKTPAFGSYKRDMCQGFGFRCFMFVPVQGLFNTESMAAGATAIFFHQEPRKMEVTLLGVRNEAVRGRQPTRRWQVPALLEVRRVNSSFSFPSSNWSPSPSSRSPHSHADRLEPDTGGSTCNNCCLYSRRSNTIEPLARLLPSAPSQENAHGLLRREL
jgi:hypothetical protein